VLIGSNSRDMDTKDSAERSREARRAQAVVGERSDREINNDECL